MMVLTIARTFPAIPVRPIPAGPMQGDDTLIEWAVWPIALITCLMVILVLVMLFWGRK